MTDQVPSINDRLLRRPAVQTLTGLPKTSLYDQIRDKRFPEPVRLGVRSIAWRLSDVQAWLDARVPVRK